MPGEDADSRDALIGRIVNEYLDRKHRGEAVREEDLLEAHPELAEELRSHFGMVREVVSVSSGSSKAQSPPLPADFLPGYEILDEIHRGGQGVVYLALQKATRRKVAVKVTHEGPFAGWRDRARFEREVHVLGALRHPSIVTIHDSGAIAGSQYFVMDYISGLPLDAWLAKTPHTVEQILRLFVTICDAINAAHIKGIIHRDLKPGNVRMDDEGRPHILDFGLAKLTTDQEADKADMTAIGQFVGSLPWTSPEQAQGSLDQIDTRTDVYALGVMLYQTLTGTFPYEVVGPVRDVLNRIVSVEPSRPGTIRSEINRDVDAIVLKCLRKDSHRRYQTAGELGRDIERFLAGQPVVARSDSGLYVLGKLLWRYRFPVAVAATFALLVAVSLLGSLSLWRQAAAERDRALSAEHEQDRERRRADAKAAEAEQALRIGEQQHERLRRITYLNHIALAQNACEKKYMSQARSLLDACPPDLRNWEWSYLRRLSRQPTLLDVPADSKSVLALAVSPDGRRIAEGGYDGIIRIWDTHDGAATPNMELKGHSLQVQAVAFSPDGKFIASGSLDKTLRVWDARTGSSRIFEQGREYVNCVAFSPDSMNLVSGGFSKVLTVWDVAGGTVIRRSTAHEGEISCVAYSPDGKRIVSGEYLNTFLRGTAKVRLWEAGTGQGKILLQQPASILSVAFSPDGSRIAAGSGLPAAGGDAQGTLKIIQSATGEAVFSLRGHDGFVNALAYSPDGRLLASSGAPRVSPVGADSDHTLKIWEMATGAERCVYSAHSGGGRAVVWSPDGTRVFSGGMDGRLKAWPSSTPPEARILRGHSSAVLRVAFSPDGKRLASSGGPVGGEQATTADNTVRVWNQRTGSQLLVFREHTSAVRALAWSPDGTKIASSGTDGILLWDSNSGSQQSPLFGQNQIAQSIAFSPDAGATGLLAGVTGTTVTLWQIPDAKERGQLRQDEMLVGVTCSPDGKWIATGSESGAVRIWDSSTRLEHRLIITGARLNRLTFSPGSEVIATGHTNGTIGLWDCSSGRQVASMIGPRRSVQSIAFSPDGHRIISCSEDTMVRLWDVGSGTEVYALRAHDAPVMCATFNPDGTEIATCGQDGLIKIWDTRTPASTQTAPAEIGR